MALDPADLVSLADRLLAESGGDEAACRTAISRMYYACHLSARDQRFGLDAGAAPGQRPSHRAVIREVQAQTGVDAARDLEDLKRMREVADYVRDLEHPEVRAVFARQGVSDWSALADVAAALTRDLLPLLQAIPAATAGDA